MSIDDARKSLRDKVNRQKYLKEQARWVNDFNRMVRVANWRLNVEKRWPSEVPII